jgi:hypothetical protein
MAILLFAILSQLPTTAAMNGGMVPERMENRQLRTRLSPEAQWMIEFFSWIYAFGILCRCILGLFMALDLLIPFLPVYFAPKGFANIWFADQQISLDQTGDSRTVSKWIFILPLIVLFYCSNRNPRRITEFIFACCLAVIVGTNQAMIANPQGQLLLPLWDLGIVNAALITLITATHLAGWCLYLVLNQI